MQNVAFKIKARPHHRPCCGVVPGVWYSTGDNGVYCTEWVWDYYVSIENENGIQGSYIVESSLLAVVEGKMTWEYLNSKERWWKRWKKLKSIRGRG